MGKGPEQTLIQRGHTDGQQTYEKMLKSRTRDMEIKNKLTVIREGKGIMGERKGRGKSSNMNRGLMDTDNGVGIDCGSWGAWVRGERW